MLKQPWGRKRWTLGFPLRPGPSRWTRFIENQSILLSRAGNLRRIRKSILATILVTLWYENQFPSLDCVPNVSVILNLILANSNEFPPLVTHALDMLPPDHRYVICRFVCLLNLCQGHASYWHQGICDVCQYSLCLTCCLGALIACSTLPVLTWLKCFFPALCTSACLNTV